MKIRLCGFAVLLLCINSYGQTSFGHSDTIPSAETVKIYHVNRPVVFAITAVGLFTDYFAISRIKNKPEISDDEIAGLNPDILTSFDRLALNQNPVDRQLYRDISDYSQIPFIMLPGLLALNKTIRKDWWDLLLMYAEGHTITFTIYNYSFLGPTFQNRYRPFTYYTQFTMDQRINGNNRNSFYSGHVASCAYSTFFMAKVYCDYHPDIGGGKYLWYAAASIPPLFMSYCRVKALDHFPSDDAVGFMLGAAVGIIIPEFHKNCNKNVSLGLLDSPDELGLTLTWKISSQ